MYNLFVSGREESWDGEPWTLELGRCVREYTDQEITGSFGDFTKDQINSMKNDARVKSRQGWREIKFRIEFNNKFQGETT